ncbi:hypothetical protein V5O48_013825 [Marasmius crinis-equi]|uniref:WW domain-containing protein n=1 Tax=Marasmius crinis-equi TaxID=585013 RepID=A0ABR3EZ07_9AGAR
MPSPTSPTHSSGPDKTRKTSEETKEERSPGSTPETAEKTADTERENSEEKSRTSDSSTSTPAPASTPWQAIYSPQFNTYYFYNTETQETTWENPLVPSSSTSAEPSSSSPPADPSTSNTEPSSSSSTAAPPSYSVLQAAAIAQGIDPSLAHLDPSLAATGPGAGVATARFNARTGQFARSDARDPSHLSEYERMKRMSEFYFDVNAWEQQRSADQEEEEADGGKKRKRPTKKDVERFKEQKRQKKIAKTAWLRT